MAKKKNSDLSWTRQIAYRASSLWERSANGNQSLHTELTADRLERWRVVLGSGAALRRRLASVGLDPERLARKARSDQHLDCPPWSELLYELRVKVPLASPPAEPRERQLPFADVFAPLVEIAVQRFLKVAGDNVSVLQPAAMVSLKRHLLGHLCYVSSRTLGLAFYKYRLRSAPAASLIEHWSKTSETFRIYDEFICRMHAGGFLAILDEYPVLGRLLCQAVLQWIDSSTEFCVRARTDARILGLAEGSADCTQLIENLRCDLSDRHHNGRTVIWCLFRGGHQLVYKPRGLAGEKVFCDLLDLLNLTGALKKMKVPHITDRGEYGWMEFVPRRDCSTVDHLHSFYRRTGTILCASFLVSATDLHYENIVASGEYPVAVDLEAIFCGRNSAGQAGEKTAADLPDLLQTGLLPLGEWLQNPQNNRAFLGKQLANDVEIPLVFWNRANCDQMTAVNGKSEPNYDSSLPRWDGRITVPSEFIEDIAEGFSETYDCIMQCRQAVSRLMQQVGDEQVSGLRVIVRNSSTYGNILEHLLKPAFLRDGLDRTIELDWLARPLSGPYDVRDGRLKIFEHELKSLERLDIPHFIVGQWDAFGLADDDDFFRYHPIRSSSVPLSRLASMSAGDRDEHIAIIRTVLSLENRTFAS